MADHAISDHPGVQAQLDRLAQLSPGADILGLDRIERLLARLGNPQDALPPVFHVAGTNGKGSTCAFLRAAMEAQGYGVHVYTSPHLVRFNERIRLNGALVGDEMLADVLERVLDQAGTIGASFFEVTTAAAFLLFAEHPADACIVEVGLGGRLDATNVIARPAMCGIAQLGIDHQAFLGGGIRDIAAEKAGIAKAEVPLVTQRYDPAVAAIIAASAARARAPWLPMGGKWDAALYRDRLHYRDGQGRFEAPLPRLSGSHQAQNAALAFAMLRHQSHVEVQEAALKAAPLWATWPARLQRLSDGPFVHHLSPRGGREIWLDGGHNPDAGRVLARYFEDGRLEGRKLRLIIGMLANKDAQGFLAPLRRSMEHIHVVPVPGHEYHDGAMFGALAREWDLGCSLHDDPVAAARALTRESPDSPVLICGSLYLAGEILRLNEQLPD